MAEMTLARIAENQSRFRRANEQIELAAEDQGLYGLIPFLCECSEAECMEIVELTMVEYENVRARPERFFAAPSHEGAAVEGGAEAVVEEHRTYVIIDKIGVAGEIAKEQFANLQVKVAPDLSRDPTISPQLRDPERPRRGTR